ncbi:MAG: hypothetical protein AcusKO_12820 [Acuticoccus sp.]
MVASATWGSTNLGGTIGLLQGGTKLRVAYWRGPADGPGTIVLVQGRTEFIECYGETIADLLARGFSVVTFDLRGQGGSDRRTSAGHVDSFRQYCDDIAAVTRFAAQIDMVRPFTVLAHSMGGLAALLAQPLLPRDVERMVLAAPLLKIADLPMPRPLIGLVAGAASLVGLGRMAAGKAGPPASPERFPHNRVTSDPARYARLCRLINDNPDLTTGPPTYGWLRAALKAMRAAERMKGKELVIPTLFLSSAADTVVAPAAIDAFARATPGAGLVLLRGAKHQIFTERDALRDLAFTALDAFVEDRAPRRTTPQTARGRTRKFVVGEQADPIGVMSGWRLPDEAAPAAMAEPAGSDSANDAAGASGPLKTEFNIETPWIGGLEGDADILDRIGALTPTPDAPKADTPESENTDAASAEDAPATATPDGTPASKAATPAAAEAPAEAPRRRRHAALDEAAEERGGPSLRRRKHPRTTGVTGADSSAVPDAAPPATGEETVLREPLLPPGGRRGRPR